LNFYDFIGQKEVITGLTNSIINERVGHAYVFYGPEGIGKKTLANIFATRLLCKDGEGAERCGKCSSCLLVDNGSNPDLHVIFHNDESIGVEEIRKLQSDIIIKPLYGERKVYLILNADNMTTQAQNCLLKILEEPPKYAVIVLTTANFGALLETIRSRAIKYSFKKNTFLEVRTFLEKSHNVDKEGTDFIVAYCDGVIGTAMKLSQSKEFIAIRDRISQIILQLAKADLLDVFEIYNFFETIKHNVDMAFDIMLLFYRDLMIVKKAGKENVLINSDKKDIILSNVSNFSVEKLLENIEIIELTRKNIKQNANYQLSIEVMLMKLQEEPFNGEGGWSKV
jgi:DNA polymerase III subunit delta'